MMRVRSLCGIKKLWDSAYCEITITITITLPLFSDITLLREQ